MRRRTHSLGGEGGKGVNNLEDARHSSVLYICKYFVGPDKTKRILEKFSTPTPVVNEQTAQNLRYFGCAGNSLTAT